MGYVPPNIRADLDHISRVYDISARYLSFGVSKPATPYQRWLWDTYGPEQRDWFPLVNAGLLGSLLAAVIALVWFLS